MAGDAAERLSFTDGMADGFPDSAQVAERGAGKPQGIAQQGGLIEIDDQVVERGFVFIARIVIKPLLSPILYLNTFKLMTYY